MVFRPASPVMAWQLMFPVEATSMPMKTSTLTRSALQMDTSRWLIFKIENNINTCLSIWTHQHVVTRSSRDEYSIIIQSFISNQLINKIIRSLSSMDQEILMILLRGQNNNRRYILKAIIVLFPQYKKYWYESFSDVGESWVWWRADFQSGSRAPKKVFWTFSYLYLWHTMWFHAKKLLKTLNC